jgi:hypothetical protein
MLLVLVDVEPQWKEDASEGAVAPLVGPPMDPWVTVGNGVSRLTRRHTF